MSGAIDIDMPAAGPNGVLSVNGNGHGNGHSPSPMPTSSSSNPCKPSFVESPLGLRFLICDAPNDGNLPSYVEAFKKRGVVVLARVCDQCYSTEPLLASGIQVVEIPFADGDPPPAPVVDKWLALVEQVFKRGGAPPKAGPNLTGVELDLSRSAKPVIAIHCVAGLGRAPVMVAIALVEWGMEPFDAIALIRKKRRGAINSRQLKYIENYERRNQQKGCCSVQ